MSGIKKALQIGEEKYDLSQIPRKRRRSGPRASVNQKKTVKGVNVGVTPEENTEVAGCSAMDLGGFSSQLKYEIELLKNEGFHVIDSHHFTIFAVQDYSCVSNMLQPNHYRVLKRKKVKFVDQSQWIWCCSCSESYISFYDAVLPTVGDFYSDFPKHECMHCAALCNLLAQDMQDVDTANIDDHTYSIATSEMCDIWEIPFECEIRAVVLCDENVGIVRSWLGDIECLVCKFKGCPHVAKIKAKMSDDGDEGNMPDVVDMLVASVMDSQGLHLEHSIECLSRKKIPFERNTQMPSFDSNAQISLEHDVSNVCLKCGNACKATEPVHRYIATKKRILQCTVANTKCSNESCQQLCHYDGLADCVLNMGSFLIHHEVLREYMYLFLHAKCPLHSFYTTYKCIQRDEGTAEFPKSMPYRYFRFSWYAYLNLLDLNLENGFCCEECGPSPNLVLFDGTALGNRKIYHSFGKSNVTDKEKRDSGWHNDRIFVNDNATRQQLKAFAKGDIVNFPDLKMKTARHCPSLLPLLEHIETIGSENAAPPEFQEILIALSSISPVCGTVHSSAVSLLELLLQDNACVSQMQFLKKLQNEVPILFRLISKLEHLPNYMVPVLENLVHLAKVPSLIEIEMLSGNVMKEPDSFYPCQLKLRERPAYVCDNDSIRADTCTKRKRNLVPGIFTMLCKHGICYGYSIMDSFESPEMPFKVLTTRFEKAPRYVVYDNACGLHNFCLNREAYYFKDTWFLVDRLHYRNHKACSRGYRLGDYPQFSELNSQAVEQVNASVSQLKASLTYMNNEHFHSNLQFFLWYRNIYVLKR